MMKTKTKKTIIITISAVASALAIALTIFLIIRFTPPDPKKLLAKADRLTEQNLCLMAILQKEPENQEYLRQLLLNYQLLGADPLTIEATRGDAAIELPEERELQPEEKGAFRGIGGIVQSGRDLTDYKGVGELVSDGETFYLAREDGIYADYHRLQVRISPARAEKLTAAENGLYFLNTITHRVQYISRDGHRTETLSPVPAADYAFLGDTLWIAGTDGGLYKGDTLTETDFFFEEVCTLDGKLYVITKEGIAHITEQGVEFLLPSPASMVLAGKGVLYYIDENGFPARFDPKKMEAVILEETPARAISFDQGKLYFMNEENKIKKVK